VNARRQGTAQRQRTGDRRKRIGHGEGAESAKQQQRSEHRIRQQEKGKKKQLSVPATRKRLTNFNTYPKLSTVSL